MKAIATGTILWFLMLPSVTAAQSETVATLPELLESGAEIKHVSFQSDIGREAIYLEVFSEMWVCLVAYNLTDFSEEVRAPYVGGGACLNLRKGH